MKNYRTGFILLYLAAVIGLSVTVNRPEFCALSFGGAFCAGLTRDVRKTIGFTLKVCVPIAVVAAFVNPLFNHMGVTVLFYLGDNPITAEAFYYGCAGGGMLAAVVLWFRALGDSLTGEGFTAMLGKVMPKTALTLSVALGCEPKLRADIAAISEARAMLGEKKNLRHGLKTLDAAVGCALEDSVETAAAMRARGFGLRPRTRYKPNKGGVPFAFAAVAAAAACIAARCLAAPFWYYPIFTMPYAAADALAAAAFGILCFAPAAAGVLSELKWRCLKSKI